MLVDDFGNRLSMKVTTSSENMHGGIKYKDDYVGMRFGHLVVIGYPAKNGKRRAGAICKCDCGRYEHFFSAGDLINGRYDRCRVCRKKLNSVRQKERAAEWSRNHPGLARNGKKANPLWKERLYRIWYGMNQRCQDKTRKGYGADGVTVCDEWKEYPAFRKWAFSHGFDEKATGYECSIDRINPFGNYEPSNCRWVSFAEQNRNKREHWANLTEEEKRERMIALSTS